MNGVLRPALLHIIEPMKSLWLESSTPGSLTLKLPSKTILTSQYVLKVPGKQGVVFENEKYLSVSRQKMTTLIQTDKAMYKGRQTVNFRVVTIYPNLKPFKGEVDVDITDDKGNRMKQWKGRSSSTGVILERLHLSEEPRTGTWFIKVRIPSLSGYSKQQSFLVQHYELPKFEVKVELPPFGLHSDTEIHGTVKATYTFGKPVEGHLDLRAYAGVIRDSCGMEAKSVQQVSKINGEEKFIFSVADIKKSRSYWNNLSNVQIVARVTEKVTGKTLNGTGEISIYQSKYKVDFLPITPSTFKPGLPYTAYVKVTTQDGVPVTAQTSRDKIEVYTCADFTRQDPDQNKYACHQFQGTYALPKQSLSPTPSGIAKVDIGEIPVNTTSIKMKAWFKEIQQQYTVSSAYSKSNNYIQISIKPSTNKIKVDQELEFSILTTEPVDRVHYMIKARGKVHSVESHNMLNPQSSTVKIPVTTSMSPSSHILVYYTRGTGEIVADGLTFSVDRLFNHEVSLKYNREKATPDDSIDLIVSGKPRAQVFVLAVDQSVLLLKSGNDLTQDKVKAEMEMFSDVPNAIKYPNWRYGYQSSASRFQQFFQEAGVTILSDLDEFRQTRRKYRPQQVHYGGEARGAPGMPGYSSAPLPIAGLAEPDRVRSVFPETWYWENKTVGADGTATFNAKAPDTITSWVASAFGVHNNLGLGVAAETASLLVEKPFFVSLNLPSSVKFGEVVAIQAIVFNYLDQAVPVTVSLTNSNDFYSVDILSNGDEQDSSEDKSVTVTVPSGSPTPIYFPIRPRIRGRIDIEVTARSFLAADAVRRQLLVRPEGIRREKNTNLIVKMSLKNDFEKSIDFNPPTDIVPDTMKIKLSATGDILGLTVDNLRNLIQLPTGCGEQNMMKFVPNIYIADYLYTTNQAEDNLVRRIKQYLELGYQKQLTYQRYDWAYGPFGESDPAGSIWLTSFVIRSFQQASEYIYIDDDKTASSISWVLDRQNLDGSFTEQGTIIDRHLQESTMGLTAYVLASLIEIRDNVQILYKPYNYYKNETIELFNNVTRNATRYLEKNIDSTTDVYELAIASYVLTRTGSPKAGPAFTRLEAMLVSRGDTKHLKVKKETKNQPKVTNNDVITSHDIIATSYLLMTYLESGDIQTSFSVMKFLLSQRNKNGGFKSSQDTVVALEALSKFAAATRPADFNMGIDIRTDTGEVLQFKVHSQNALVLQQKPLKGDVKNIKITGRGNGVGYLDISTVYHVTGDSTNTDFDISTVLLDDNINGFTLMTCCKVLNDEPTGMATAKVQIPAGFEPDISNINVVGVRKVEKSGNDVNIYYDQIGETSTCVSLQASRSSMVSSSQKCFVEVTDYYQPSKSSTVSYHPRKLKNSKVCDVCPDCNMNCM
ncbi:hypothetical protein LOTGIDRAFT_162872 [Lottia gigantea]|uniref:CD109 antigen n=1 Tax=Lottia gigantea TaxID=225164 RepID=V4A659_LOTGI|nr:hypothetical protein LOTGIDRAFT_162872 [Lottia gigantea]ESO92217.1 hypothetical protein LOTGIDRAFT_162872 [Lottia gigantea]